MESAFFIPDIVKATSMEEMVIANSSFLHPHADNTGVSKDVADKEIEIAEVENVERPVDLYKVLHVHEFGLLFMSDTWSFPRSECFPFCACHIYLFVIF